MRRPSLERAHRRCHRCTHLASMHPSPSLVAGSKMPSAPCNAPADSNVRERRQARAPVTMPCDDKCGCAVPCPGGAACRCAGKKQRGGGGAVPVNPAAVAHTTCTCGEHCSCRPCSCGRLGSGDGAGRADCTCGPTCTCVVCTT
ncbi:hypothetical protein ZWY2020_035214 [Hordeum vulgare]|nr:hypothetical protein ZWY2020_035214 [Hordeum vulgare]